ncbi:hypothetical protein [Tenuibacillus multivorans]|uniref:Uncharacterized protein n=1 Tax=Tenuibacillus multivorans TaxID=237069 RepID=A0A1H0FYP8_9BACI|nr:hypothetical protein [Tenuibacillus multivorans]GEL78154.1 hypothetical protein TMU01_23890 [Tenuibacillus multivorans]SDN99765.1 hypothetical protein SAMN05216498_0402 [Tenuibacillus multivorans]
MNQHLLVVKHDQIGYDVVLRLLHMVLQYKQVYIKRPTLLKNDLKFYRYGDDLLLVVFKDELISEITELERMLAESGLSSTRYVNIPEKDGIIKAIKQYLNDVVSPEQIAQKLQLLDVDQLN